MKKSNSTYEEFIEQLNQMEEMHETFVDLVKNNLKDDGFIIARTDEFMSGIEKVTISKMPDEEVKEAFNMLTYGNTEEKTKGILLSHYEFSMLKDEEMGTITTKVKEMEDDAKYQENKVRIMRNYLLIIKDGYIEIERSAKEVKDTKAEAQVVLDDYAKYLASDEFIEKKKAEIEKLEKQAEEETDPIKKKACLVSLNGVKSLMSLSFITRSIDGKGEEEIKNIVNGFFDAKKSAYTLKRFKDKIKQFGYKDNIHTTFFQLEEKFLDEKYHVFNNLFLFHMMRFIANADRYSKFDSAYVQSFISNCGNLVYHKFADGNKEVLFKETVSKFLDLFENYRDKFEKDNILQPNHPKRLAHKKELDDSTRNMMFDTLKKYDYEITEEMKTMPSPALRDLYEAFLDDYNKAERERSPIQVLLKKINYHEENYKREALKKQYMSYAELSDEVNAKFDTTSIEELEGLVNDEKEKFENEVAVKKTRVEEDRESNGSDSIDCDTEI